MKTTRPLHHFVWYLFYLDEDHEATPPFCFIFVLPWWEPRGYSTILFYICFTLMKTTRPLHYFVLYLFFLDEDHETTPLLCFIFVLPWWRPWGHTPLLCLIFILPWWRPMRLLHYFVLYLFFLDEDHEATPLLCFIFVLPWWRPWGHTPLLCLIFILPWWRPWGYSTAVLL